MLFAVLNPVHPFPTKQSFQPSSCRLIQTQVTENLLFLNLSPAHSCFLSGFQDKSMIQKCKQTTHQALNSFPSLTSISKTCFSDTCRLKSDCCKQACCSFSWKFLPLLSSATTNCGLGYFGKKKKYNNNHLLWFDFNTSLLLFAAWMVQLPCWNSNRREKDMGFISLEAYTCISSVHAQQSEVFLVLLYMYCTEIFFFPFI